MPDEAQADALLRAAFDPGTFRLDGAAMVRRMSAYLESALAGTDGAVLPYSEPSAMLERWRTDFTSDATRSGQSPSEVLDALTARMLADATQLHHAGFVGHQVAPPLPLAALCDLAADMLNNGMAVYEMGQAGTAMELHVIRWMCETLGLGEHAGGVLTSGGTLATLTSLLAMRQARAGWDVWTEGNVSAPLPAVLVSEQAHYCADRAVRIMGWGAGGLVKVGVDARFRMRVEDLAPALARATQDGRRVLGVVASACSTATGAFDPLEPIADFCERHGLWLHVDGAHGASLALSSRHRHVLQGIERADSVIWDAHKMLLQPALVTAVLFRDRRHSAGAFAQDASYLLDADHEHAWYDLASRTFECTKRMMSFKLYATLAAHGPPLLDAYVTRVVDLAQDFAALLQQQDDFELAVEPQCNIVCFRHRPVEFTGDDAALDLLQAQLRRAVIER
ncbi:MAG TPA: pyridoxal-dependent decarboxylase, partial [Gemmatimonadaceae bacterium]|nr:pyridoxal-dependent decarboxylase [Gemmatimonadaceae bacterium]